ncbi:1,2-phenylacetyl-CoA epoxidase subunit PaaC [Chitinophaga sancti]|uniref:1,2-phenylacetyl-CoA epoxidase subunit PaaC n=1 Tax=Chitinophaga sancti TaxID=1004 RepID=UPI002A759F23|nr:1,2-phenylacetyl-CoA epoxidase subunit PaaC [Chitinophaga sancti]WPQ64269.1 1,2-phenylacetyl-CoA epoxidase subunit PaaC [Chitinophaga sancti]
MEHLIKEFVTKMADDALILGHRNSEWTGLGPVMEEDIAFSSMAQDKIGHAWALYRILQDMPGGQDPDQFAFLRRENEYKCCHLTEMPIGTYEFSLVRHFLFDHAETVRYNSLLESKFVPLQQLAKKVRGELKYHTLHADAWMLQLGRGGQESHGKMQAALDNCFPLACGIFEPGPDDAQLSDIYPGEQALYDRWLDNIYPILTKAALNLPEKVTPAYGGRYGEHTTHLHSLLEEMGEVFRQDPAAAW